MFERFTGQSRQVATFAEEEARALRHPTIGTEHLLLGLLREEEGIAGKVLRDLGLIIEAVHVEVKNTHAAMPDDVPAHIPFTPRAKKVLELALREALSLGHNYIGTEHILLGLLREDSIAVNIIDDFLGEDASNKIRNEVIRELTGPGSRRKGAAPEPDPHAELSKAVKELKRTIEATSEFRSLLRIAKWLDEKIA